jgi:membrane protein involved in colicin uptake
MMRSQLSTRTPGLVSMVGFLCLGFAMEAAAIVGAPLTPVSVAGVARRTTRRVVVASAATTSAATTSAATASAASANAAAQSAQASAAQAQSAAQASAAQAQAAQQQAQAAQAAAARPAGAPPVGSVVSALPAGCVSAPKGGVEYQNCGGVYYRAAFQGNNLVYVVEAP